MSQCNRLTYRSQREAPDDRATRRANKLRNQLGWEPGILNDAGGKPKGMHWATFAKLTLLHDGLALEVLEGLTAKTGRLMARIGAVLDTLPAPLKRKVRRAIQRPPSIPSR